jgi:hypothetical protein
VATVTQEGLEVIAHVESFHRFEIMMRRMEGSEYGIVPGPAAGAGPRTRRLPVTRTVLPLRSSS